MLHTGMETLSRHLGEAGIATFRYQFPYMERGGGPPNPQVVLTATVGAAVSAAAEACPDLPLFAGGRSMGGRMTSLAASKSPLPRVQGLIFFAFPLHPSKRPGDARAKHLSQVTVPMLFLQGTRDTLAELDLLLPVCERLGPRATLHILEGADHSFHVLKRSGRTDEQVMVELTDAVSEWTQLQSK
jgi:predicted alpha/beta-hydrolase family hydrolase